MHTAIHIGANKKGIVAAGEIVLAILGATAEEKTKRAALKTLHTICKVEYVTVTGCTIIGNQQAKEADATEPG